MIVPCRNEMRYIESALKSILVQEGIDGGFEIIFADGGSDDGTRDILHGLANKEPRLRIIENPGRIVSTGLNAAIRAARGEIILRMDVHSEYANDYIKQCVNTLHNTHADNVGGPWRAIGKTWMQKVIALAFQSPFSSGGAGSHQVNYEGPVDSVYLGCWRKETLVRLGLFDEDLVRNQDDELNLRLIRANGTIWQSPSIQSWYYPRASLLALSKQYLQYGYWKVRVIQKHRLTASIRHLVPGGFVGTLLALGLLSFIFGWARLAFAVLLGLYFCGNLCASVVTCRRLDNLKYLPAMPMVFAAYHFSYGWGFIRGVFDFILLKSAGRDSFGKLTR